MRKENSLLFGILGYLCIVSMATSGAVFKLNDMTSDETMLALVFFWIPLILVAPYLANSAIRRFIKERAMKKRLSDLVMLRKKILRLAFEKGKQLSMEEIEISVPENEDEIAIVLRELIEGGKVVKYANEAGIELYRFNISVSEEDKKELRI